jgi:uncharacterized protein (TIGR03437 family)
LAGGAAAQDLPPCTIETFAGSDVVLGEGMPATEAELFRPIDARRAPDGSLWISEYGHNVIRRVGPDGTLRTVVGTGVKGFAGDGGPAVSAQISEPTSLLFAPDGTLYFHDSGNSRIRRVSPEGVIETVVGSATSEWAGEDAPALSVRARGTVGLAFSPTGDLIFSTSSDHRVRRLTSDGRVVTLAGTTTPGRTRGGYDGDGGPALEAALNNPLDIAISTDGTIYVADQFGDLVRRIAPDSTISTYLRRGLASPDGTPVAEATMRSTTKLEVDGEGRLYWHSSTGLRRVSSEGLLETVADLSPRGAFSLEPDGTPLIIWDETVSRWDGSDLIPLAGIGAPAPLGDGGPATAARLYSPHALAVGPAGEIYIADTLIFRVRVVGKDGIIRNVAETVVEGSDIPGGSANEAPLFEVLDIAVNGDGTVYVAGQVGWLSRIDANGVLSTVVPPSNFCVDEPGCGDGGPAAEAQTPSIQQIAADSVGNVYVLHERPGFGPGQWIRRIAPDGTIETLPTRFPDGTSARSVSGIAIGVDDQLLVSMGDGAAGPFWRYHPDNGWSEIEFATGFLSLTPTMAEASGDLFFVEQRFGSRVRRMDPNGTIATIAGGLFQGFSGDEGPAAKALLSDAQDVVLDQAGNLYIADSANGRVRRVNRALECPGAPMPVIAFNSIRNGASYSALLSPGAIFSIFGRAMGPEDLVGARVEGSHLSTELEGVRVLIDGIPAPLIFVSAGQLSGIVPYGVELDLQWSEAAQQFFPARFSVVEVERDGFRSDPYPISLYDAAPGIFSLDSSGRGQGAILNQDGSLNGSLNRAALGSVVVLYATGEGLTDPPSEDGTIAAGALQKPLLPVTVKIGGTEAGVLYAGAAPGLTAGVMQVNVRIPEGLTQRGAVSIELIVGDRSSGTGVVVIVGE